MAVTCKETLWITIRKFIPKTEDGINHLLEINWKVNWAVYCIKSQKDIFQVLNLKYSNFLAWWENFKAKFVFSARIVENNTQLPHNIHDPFICRSLQFMLKQIMYLIKDAQWAVTFLFFQIFHANFTDWSDRYSLTM